MTFSKIKCKKKKIPATSISFLYKEIACLPLLPLPHFPRVECEHGDDDPASNTKTRTTPRCEHPNRSMLTSPARGWEDELTDSCELHAAEF